MIVMCNSCISPSIKRKFEDELLTPKRQKQFFQSEFNLFQPATATGNIFVDTQGFNIVEHGKKKLRQAKSTNYKAPVILQPNCMKLEEIEIFKNEFLVFKINLACCFGLL